MKTIKLQGKDYVPVPERIKEFHKLHENGSIVTNFKRIPLGDPNKMATPSSGNLKDVGFVFKATVTPDVKEKIFFTGHSFGSLGTDKAFEKTETVSIGRALANANIGLTDSIASAEEMEDFQQPTATPVKAVASTKVSKEQTRQIVELAEGVGPDYLSTLMQHLADGHDITALDELSAEQAVKIISDLKNTKK